MTMDVLYNDNDNDNDNNNDDNSNDQVRELNKILNSKTLSAYTNYNDDKINEFLNIILSAKVLLLYYYIIILLLLLFRSLYCLKKFLSN